MNEAVQKAKLTQDLARLNLHLRNLEQQKSDYQRDITAAEQEVTKLKAELDAFRRTIEQKKHELEHQEQQHARLANHAKGAFQSSHDKMALERQLSQKEMENERQSVEAKRKVADIKRKHYTIEQEHAQGLAEKRDIERELEAIKKSEELAKRDALKKPKQIEHKPLEE